jgi:putative FmdB family regulatory protein
MPIYEYACPSCGHRFEKLVRSVSGDQPQITCPQCQGQEAQRLVSAFAVAGSGASPDLPIAAPAVGGG